MEIRLGDTIDDHCGSCRQIMDHAVVAMLNGEVVKVRCRTCNREHPYRKGKGGKQKETSAQQAFNDVLAGILGDRGEAPEDKPKRRRPGGK